MAHEVLDTVVLRMDLSEYGLRKGDLGAVVEVYEPDGLEVEFVTASGKTETLVTLKADAVRSVVDNDLVAVRPFNRSAWQAPSIRPLTPGIPRIHSHCGG